MQPGHKYIKRAQGHCIPEFGASLWALVTVIALAGAGAIVPLRYLIASGIVTNLARSASLSGKRSLVPAAIAQNSLVQLASQCGITFGAAKISIICISSAAGNLTVQDDDHIPADWLPGGKNAPCSYLLQLNENAILSGTTGGSSGIPGVNGPLTMSFAACSTWENMGCDPTTQEFFINE